MADNSESNEDVTRVPDPTQALSSSEVAPPRPTGPGPRPRRSGRLGFVFLLLLVVVGVVLSAVLLRGQLRSALGRVGALETRLDEAESDLAAMQTQVNDLQEANDTLNEDLTSLSEDSRAELSALRSTMTYYALLEQAQSQAAKALLSISKENIGQARSEVEDLQTTLAAAALLAGEPDAATLDDLASRTSSVIDDLDDNLFAAEQTLEVVWRDLDELTAQTLGE